MTELLHRDAVNVLTKWSSDDEKQLGLRRAYLDFLRDHPDGVVRECRVGHITASALVMDESATSVLLTLHPKVGRWLQLGGHIESTDASVRAAALRETVEESGLPESAMSIGVEPLCLDRHPVPCGPGPMSEHLDVQFLVTVPHLLPPVRSNESDDLRWFSLDELPNGLDESVLRLIRAAQPKNRQTAG
jgi:8-oxo-dGTP pyrophosphatase MutT (NUDIX family)